MWLQVCTGRDADPLHLALQRAKFSMADDCVKSVISL